jgi:predicted GTPase
MTFVEEGGMNRKRNSLLAGALVAGALCTGPVARAQVTIEVMNPRGEIPPPKTLGISPRGGSLDGKKIVLIDNGKYGASNFLDALADMLKRKYPTATVVMYPKPAAQTITDLPKWYPTVKPQGDLFVFGVGD